MLRSDELLARLSAVLRQDIGPAVADPFAKTQAFMGSVVLEKLAAQVRWERAHAEADHTDRSALAADLAALLTPGDPEPLRRAAGELDGADGEAALGRLVAALYAHRQELGAERFDGLLARVRTTLRARLDRQLEVAS